jgi:hypothetical protein
MSIVQALQDYEYMTKWSQGTRDPFIVTGERQLDNTVIRTVMRKLDPTGALEDSKGYEELPPLGPWEKEYIPVTDTRSGGLRKLWIEAFMQRLLMAGFAGLFLLGPMWLMILKPGRLMSLGVVTGFVAAFGLAMALWLKAHKDVLSSAAAYAAVLVVFVGTGQGGQS